MRATSIEAPPKSPTPRRSITDQDAYDLLDLGVAYTTANENWRFAVEGKNILDEEYRVAGYDFGAHGRDRRVQPDRLLRPAAHRLGQRATYRY